MESWRWTRTLQQGTRSGRGRSNAAFRTTLTTRPLAMEAHTKSPIRFFPSSNKKQLTAIVKSTKHGFPTQPGDVARSFLQWAAGLWGENVRVSVIAKRTFLIERPGYPLPVTSSAMPGRRPKRRRRHRGGRIKRPVRDRRARSGND